MLKRRTVVIPISVLSINTCVRTTSTQITIVKLYFTREGPIRNLTDIPVHTLSDANNKDPI